MNRKARRRVAALQRKAVREAERNNTPFTCLKGRDIALRFWLGVRGYGD